jgi:N-acetylglucosaminyldiphosphoundecaprenol N-acetyl-beta-D-mannosaminyltransferase
MIRTFGMSKDLNAKITIRSTSCEESVNHVRKILSYPNSKNHLQIRFLNSYNLGLAFLKKDYFSILAEGGINLPDGKPVQLLSRFFCLSKSAVQIRGIDFFRFFLACENIEQVGKHLFIGGTQDSLNSINLNIGRLYPNVTNLHYWNPGNLKLNELDFEYLSKVMIQSEVNVIWIGLGTPLQDFISDSISNRYPNTATINIGAAFDFFSGTKTEAPYFVRKFGFEWLHRFISEPKRLFKRYFLVSPLFPLLFISRKVRFVVDLNP